MKIGLLVLMFMMTSAGFALELAPVFTDHMVLQRGAKVPVWGTAKANAKIMVTFAGQSVKTRANKKGDWKVSLKPLKANSTAAILKVRSSSQTVEINDVLVGEVWFACGQSNMRWEVKQSAQGGREIPKADFPEIRLLDYRANKAFYPNSQIFPVEKLRGLTADTYYQTKGWQSCSPQTAASFSAVAYYFAKDLHEELDVPIGVIHTAVGGTLTESYISREKMASVDELKSLSENWLSSKSVGTWCQGRARRNLSAWIKQYPKEPLAHHPFEPGFLFDAGIRPLISFAIKGAIWYQGESNAPTSTRESYVNGYDIESSKLKMVTMVNDWRERWGQGKFPFLYVQLPGMNRPWPIYREMQFELRKSIKNTGMAVTYDWGHPTNVHPGDKKVVGHRLALIAQRKIYKKDVVYSGPVYKAFKVKGSKILLRFSGVGKGDKALATFNGDKDLKGFEIAGENGEFYPATATIKGDGIVLFSAKVKKATQARYAWMNDPKGKANFGNKAGLPASPFRTSKK